MGRVRFVSSSISLRSLSSQRRFRVFFAGGSTDGDEAWTEVGGDVGGCVRGGDMYVDASVWVLDVQVAGLLRFCRRWRLRVGSGRVGGELVADGSSVILDGKARSETHRDITLVEADSVGRCCSCGGASCWVRFPPLATLAQVGTVREEGARRGGEFSCCVPARRLDQPATPEGEAGGRGWEVSPCLQRRFLTPRPLGGGRGGVGPGTRYPSYPGPTGGGWGGARVVCRIHPLTTNVGWELTNVGWELMNVGWELANVGWELTNVGWAWYIYIGWRYQAHGATPW